MRLPRLPLFFCLVLLGLMFGVGVAQRGDPEPDTRVEESTQGSRMETLI